MCDIDITDVNDLVISNLSLGDGRATFLPVIYNKRNLFVKILNCEIVSLNTFTSEKGMHKHYMSVIVEDNTKLKLESITEWLRALHPDNDVHPVLRDNVLKMKLLPSDDGAFDCGLFDSDSRPTNFVHLKPGCTVDLIVHVANVWHMRKDARKSVGALLVGTQFKLHPKESSKDCVSDAMVCLIHED